ncbi:MAG: FecR domain-containing protein [Spirochaetes bacterium]|nr:FecR domain-containing protein [Spirochaetota bacterium]
MKHLSMLALAAMLVLPAFPQEGIRVNKVKGAVAFQKRGEPGGAVSAGQILPADSQIQTGEGASAEIKFPDGSIITVGPSTRFRLSTVTYGEGLDSGKFNIDYGKILAKFSKIEKKRDYQFITPTSVAGVRGTAFGLGVSQGADQLVVTEGTVALGNDRTPPQMVGAGQFAAIGQEGFSTPPRPSTPADIKTMEDGVPGGFAQLGQPAAQASPAPAPAPEPTPAPKETKPAPEPASKAAGAPASSTPPSQSAPAKDAPKSEPAAAPAGKPFGMGFDFGPVVLDGQTMTRIALSPELRLGKFRMGLDLEVFLDGTGKPSNRGWDFSSTQAALDTILRKITYIQWSEKLAVTGGSDPVFFRVGQLESVTLGMGYIMDGYNNGLRYPAEKALGLDFALGVGKGFRLGFEYMINNFADLANQGMIMGGRLFVNPFGGSQSAILKGLQIGGAFAGDFNQYAGLRTTSAGNAYKVFPTITSRDNRVTLNGVLSNMGVNNALDLETPNEVINRFIAKRDFFGMWGADFKVPLIKNAFQVYGQMAMNIDPAQAGVDEVAATGWGFSAPGLYGSIGLADGTRIFSLKGEFRRQTGLFNSGYFNRNYDTVRSRPDATGVGYLANDSVMTGSTYSGVYGWAELYLVLFYGSASYEALFAESTGTFGMGTFQAKLVFNKEILKKVPAVSKILNNFEGYFVKRNISNPLLFWQPSPDMTWGYDLDLQLGGTPVHVLNRFQMTYQYNAQGVLTEQSFFSANVAMKIF